MAFSHVQTAANSGTTSVTSLAASFGATVGVGNFVIGIVSGAANNISSVTDNLGNTYTLSPVVTSASGSVFSATFQLFNITNGPLTLTLHFTAGTTFPTIAFDEYSSTTQVLVGPTTNGSQSATTSPTSGSVTIPTAGALVWGGTVSEGNTTSISAGSGFTIRANSTVAGHSFTATEDQLSVGGGSIAATFTGGTSDNWTTYLVSVLPVLFLDDNISSPPRRRLWHPSISLDDISGFPFTAVATSITWADVEQYIGPKHRPWHPPVQPDVIDGFPFTTVATLTPAVWGDIEQYIGPKRRPVNAWPRPGLTRDEFLDLIGGTPLPPPPSPPPPVPGGVNRAGASLVGGLPQSIPVNIPNDPLQVVMAFSGLIGGINNWIAQAAPAIANPAPQVYTLATLPSSAKPGTIVFVVDAAPGQRLRVFWGGIWNLV